MQDNQSARVNTTTAHTREQLIEREYRFWHKISELFNHTMSNK